MSVSEVHQRLEGPLNRALASRSLLRSFALRVFVRQPQSKGDHRII